MYKGNFKFEVIKSLNSKLQCGDNIKILHFVKHYPLIINTVIRNEMDMGQFKAGKISGITNLNIIKAK